jgi:hypothetical protein
MTSISNPTLAAQRRALPAWGGRVDSPSKRDSAAARELPKNAWPTPSRVHAVLGNRRSQDPSCQKEFTTLCMYSSLMPKSTKVITKKIDCQTVYKEIRDKYKSEIPRINFRKIVSSWILINCNKQPGECNTAQNYS